MDDENDAASFAFNWALKDGLEIISDCRPGRQRELALAGPNQERLVL